MEEWIGKDKERDQSEECRMQGKGKDEKLRGCVKGKVTQPDSGRLA